MDVPPPATAVDAVVVSDGAYGTIQEAIDDGAQSILVGTGYDPTGESYPIEIKATDDGDWTPVVICGTGPNTVTVGDRSQPADTIQIHGNGNHYGAPVQLSNLSLASHPEATVLKVACLSAGRLQNAIIEDSGTAIEITSPYIEEYESGSFDWTIRDVAIWRCRNGVRLEDGAAAHNVLLANVDITACENGGVYAENCASVTFRDGAVQLNHGWGFELRDTVAATIQTAYIEGNGRDRKMPIEVYGRRAHSLSIRDCYFHGTNPRGASHDYEWVQRAVNLHDSDGAVVRDCDGRRYGDCFAVAFGDQLILDNVRCGADTVATITPENIVTPQYS